MRTDFTNISNALNSLVGALTETHKSLLDKANAEREEALALYARMNETKMDLDEFTSIVGGMAKQLNGISDVATEHAMKVHDAVFGGFDLIPNVPYEDFYDFCDHCGTCLTYEDKHEVTTDGDVLCADCLAKCGITDEDETEEA
jgi:hypothetical protein